MVGVTAPAGYGKSTLLSQWARAEDRPVGWVSLHRFDDDPVTLLVLMASAYSRIWPDDGALAADMAGAGVSVLGRAAPRLASAFAASPGPFVLMLDDLHEVRSPACHDALSVAVDGVPDGSQLVTASRVEQPHLPRLRASGDAIELLGSDLALDVGGARQIFSQAGVSLSDEEIAAVTERTEGWAVGLSLAALIASDGDGSAAGVSGDDRYVADYLYRESLMRLSEADQMFLRRTAVLDQMCAPLCDAVLEESGTQARLRAMEASNAFLVPLDRRREWYRYHALYREFLLGELRRVEPDVIADAPHSCRGLVPGQRIADAWRSSTSSTPTSTDRCVALVTELLLPTYLVGQVSTVQRWLDRARRRRRSRPIRPSRSWRGGSPR